MRWKRKDAGSKGGGTSGTFNILILGEKYHCQKLEGSRKERALSQKQPKQKLKQNENNKTGL